MVEGYFDLGTYTPSGSIDERAQKMIGSVGFGFAGGYIGHRARQSEIISTCSIATAVSTRHDITGG